VSPAPAAVPLAFTDSGIPVALHYDDPVDPVLLGNPGEPPFTRGPYPTMYREKAWTMRQYAGFGGPEEANERYRYLLDQGQTALSVAFDLPTQLGYDSDHEMAEAEVGRVGVAIDTADDMCRLFEGLPLDRTSVNFTINATAPIILAFYLVAAERQGVALPALSGTTQNDILKEFLARKTFIFPPAPSMRLVADVVEWSAGNLPRFNPISITGYHAREAGCDAIQELGLTMGSAVAYTEELLARGLDIDHFAPRLSFHFATTLDIFEEVAKLRAARRLWWTIATERFGASRPESGRLRFFSGCSGATLTAQQPLNNVIRSTIQCIAAVLGGAQSIHVMGYDEALEIPSEEAVTLALRTQQIVAHESGLTKSVDPMGGSFYLESLTSDLEQRALGVVAELDEMGGAVAALEKGEPQRWIAEAAYRYEREIAEGDRVKVGVNRWTEDEDPRALRLFRLDDDAAERQVARVRTARAERETALVRSALVEVDRVAASNENLMPALLVAARAGATIGEISDVLRARFGEYREPGLW
jgi:methylmalonyl-CoA mutase N-terminal domain/subunit